MAYDLNGQQAAAQQGQTQSAFGGISQAVNGGQSGQSIYNPLTGQGVKQSDGPVQKTQDESVAPGGGQAAGAPNQAAPDLSKNVGLNRQDINNTAFLNKAKDQVSDIGKNLQQQANAYTTGGGPVIASNGTTSFYQGGVYPQGIGNSTLDSAVNGDADATKAANDFYTGTYNAPTNIVPDFSKISTEINGLNGLQTDAGRVAAFQQQSGDPANYTAGDGTFDNLVLKNDPAFKQTMADITKGQGDLVQQQADFTKSVPLAIQANYTKAHQADMSAADAYLGQKQKAIQDAIAKQYADAQGQVPGQLAGYQTQAYGALDQAEAPFKDILAKGPNAGASQSIANLEQYRNPDYLQNTAHVYGVDAPSGPNGYATDGQLAQFANIQKLLAHGGTPDLTPVQAYSAGSANPYYDSNKLGELIKRAIGTGATPATPTQPVQPPVKPPVDPPTEPVDPGNDGKVKVGEVVNSLPAAIANQGVTNTLTAPANAVSGAAGTGDALQKIQSGASSALTKETGGSNGVTGQAPTVTSPSDVGSQLFNGIAGLLGGGSSSGPDPMTYGVGSEIGKVKLPDTLAPGLPGLSTPAAGIGSTTYNMPNAGVSAQTPATPYGGKGVGGAPAPGAPGDMTVPANFNMNSVAGVGGGGMNIAAGLGSGGAANNGFGGGSYGGLYQGDPNYSAPATAPNGVGSGGKAG